MNKRFAHLLDEFLEWSIFLSFTRLGFQIRCRLWDWSDPGPEMQGKTCLITGANSGLGLATAKGLARLGARVVLITRDAAKGEAAQREVIAASGNEQVIFEVVDIGHLQAVRKFVERYLKAEKELHVLVNNAGILPARRELTSEGFERTFATNVLGPFLLTNALLPLLSRGAPSRIIFVSSGGMYTQKLRVDDLQYERDPFDGAVAYARTKRAQVVLTEMWAERLAGSGVIVHAMHPGWVDTPGLRSSLPRFYGLMRPFLRTAEQGADTILWLSAAREISTMSGLFWHDRRERKLHRSKTTKTSLEEHKKLWRECARLSAWMDGI